MMNKTRHTNRFGMVALLCVTLGVGLLFAGCGKAPQAEKKAVTKVETKAPAVKVTPVKPPEKQDKQETATPPASPAPAAKAPEQKPAPTIDGVFLRGIELTGDLIPPVLNLAMDDNAASPVVHDAAGSYDQTFSDPGGNPNTDAHSVPGVVGTALAFDGLDDYLSLTPESHNPYLAENQDFAIAFWWKANAPDPAVTLQVLGNYANQTGESCFFFYTYGGHLAVRVDEYWPGGSRNVGTYWVNGTDGNWHHYAMVRKGTTIRFYQDGVLAIADTDAHNAVGLAPASANITLGKEASGAQHSPGSFDDFRLSPGGFDDLKLRDRALSEGVTSEQNAAQGTGAQLIDLYRSVNEAQASKSKVSSEEEAEIEKKWASLLEKSGQPFKMCDEADLVALSFERPKKAYDPYSLSLLFRVNKAFETDYHITIEASVDPSHVNSLLELDRPLGYAYWSFIPEPPTSQWKAKSLSIRGESYIFILKEVPAADIPYKINVTFVTAPGPDGQSTKYGEYARAGWMLAE